MCRIVTDHKRPLSETVEERPATLDIGRVSGGDDEELARLGGIRISEDRRRDVALSGHCMLGSRARRGGGADLLIDR